MRNGWLRTTLGATFKTVTGNTPPKGNPDFFGRYLPLVKPPELRDAEVSSAEDGLSEAGAKVARTAPPNSILVSCIGNLGKVGLNTVQVAFNQQINAIFPDENRVVPAFMFYQALSCTFKDQLEALSSGTTVPIVNKARFNSIEVVLPPISEQRRIVALLDEAFAGLATAKANAERNLQNARALVESHLQHVLTQRGEGWVDKNLSELCQVRTGKKDVNQGNPEGEFPFFTCAATHTYSDTYTFDTEALLVAGNGNVGQVSYYSGKFEVYQRTYVLFDFKGVSAKYLFRVLDKRLSATVSKQKLGNTMPYIKLGMLTEFVVPVPPVKEQEVLASRLDIFAEESGRLACLYEQKLAALEALKKSLLHQAFSGELR